MHCPARVIIDTDPGVDDAIAILTALASPALEIVGLTTVGGNVPLARATRNALALLEYAGRADVPVARGSARPVWGRFGYSYAFHSPGGLSRRLPTPRTRPAAAGAVDFMAARLAEAPGQVSLVALGPLTNLARLFQQQPVALEQVASLVVMGGAVNVPGNVTPHAEFNFYSDPEAARLVLSSGVPLMLVDLGACRRVSISREAATALRAGAPLGRLTAQLLRNWFRRDASRERFEFYDPLAIAVAIDPQIMTTYQTCLAVETSDPARLGETRPSGTAGPISVAEGVDRQRFFKLLEETLGLEGNLHKG